MMSQQRHAIEEEGYHLPAVVLDILDRLEVYGLEEYLDEVIDNVLSERMQPIRRAGGIRTLSEESLAEWIRGMNFFHDGTTAHAAHLMCQQCIDGMSFLSVSEYEWVHVLKLNITLFHLLRVIAHAMQTHRHHPGLPSVQSIEKPYGVLAGVVSDMSSCEASVARRMQDIDTSCSESGVGCVYGSLTVLGYREYVNKQHEGVFVPIGPTNVQFLLNRRKIANGLQHSSTISFEESKRVQSISSKKFIDFSFNHAHSEELNEQDSYHSIVYEYSTNPCLDQYQIGRAAYAANDFVVPGVVHVDDLGLKAGPISRWACRVECERLPPFRCFIYAGGFDPFTNRITPQKILIHRNTESAGIVRNDVTPDKADDTCIADTDGMKDSSSDNKDIDELSSIADSFNSFTASQEHELVVDGFTTFGVKILQPEVGRWVEVSVLGNIYEPRSTAHTQSNQKIETLQKNQLTNGTIVDIGGIHLIYSDPIAMAQKPTVDPKHIVHQLNLLRPHCPVLFNEITFTYANARERSRKAYKRANEAQLYGASSGQQHHGDTHRDEHDDGSPLEIEGLTVPPVDHTDLNEENRPYVFPACGHMFGYHPSFASRPCPLCRTTGPFVPVAFAFEPLICSTVPTHVFNPCGHIASKEVCDRWSHQISVYSRSLWTNALTNICPYCATELAATRPYSKLVLQTHNGDDWPARIMTSAAVKTIDHSQLQSLTQKTLGSRSSSDDHLFNETHRSVLQTIAAQKVFFRKNRYKFNSSATSARNARTTLVTRYNSFPKYAPQLESSC